MAANFDALVAQAAARHGIDPKTLARFIQIESGGNPNNTTGSYKGLLQLSDAEFKKYGGGDIYSAADNVNAGAAKLASESAQFAKKYGRPPSAAELYMVHQQGWGGFDAHYRNPDAPAWKSMAGTGEGRAKGEGWAKLAISGNMPDAWKREVAPEAITSREFMERWAAKVDGAKPAPQAVASAMRADAPATASPEPPPTQVAALPEQAQQSATPDAKQIADAMRAFGSVIGARAPQPAPFAPLQTSFKQYSSLMKA